MILEKQKTRILNINLDYKRSKEQIDILSNLELTENYINFALESSHPQGVHGQMKRIVSRLQRKVEEAVKDKKESIELEPVEIDLLKNSFEKTQVKIDIVKYWVILEDEINKLA